MIAHRGYRSHLISVCVPFQHAAVGGPRHPAHSGPFLVHSFASYPYARLSLVSAFLSSLELDRYPCPRRRDQDGRWRMLIGHVSTSCASGYGGITRKIGSLAKNTTPPRMARTSRASFSYRNSPDRRFDEERPGAEARIAVPGRIRPCQLSRGFRTAYWWGRIPNIVVVRCE